MEYASKAKVIENQVERNENNNDKLVRELQAQIELLRSQIAAGNANVVSVEDPELKLKMKELEVRFFFKN